MDPIHSNKHWKQPSVFEPSSLLREARRQKKVSEGSVPEICVLDPDGDLSRHLRDSGAKRNQHWACYHTEMYDLILKGRTLGVIGCAVGAPYAVLVAEQLFVSDCRLLISVTSAGQLVQTGEPPYFVLIDRALRDEGTSYHYLPPDSYAHLRPELNPLADQVQGAMGGIVRGGAWTTDAPFRETAEAVAFAQSENLLAVEMEAAGLYAFAKAQSRDVLCFAHVTNRMATVENDFEKGEGSGNTAFVALLQTVADAWEEQTDCSAPS
jgi:purine-nucleoside phosphorylase